MLNTMLIPYVRLVLPDVHAAMHVDGALALVLVGGGVGACMRHLCSHAIAKRVLSPWGTAAVNVRHSNNIQM